MKHACLFAALLLASAAQAQTSTLNRPYDPVVLTGASLPAYASLAPASIVGFQFKAGAWRQIPVQVDERALLDIVTPYGSAATGTAYPPAATNPRVLFYCDASTKVGADATATFDADDELVFMVADAGGRATGQAAPAGVVTGSGYEIAVTDPLGGLGYVYLFQSAGALVPGAGVSYLTYTSNLATTAGFPVNFNGTNAENTTISTARYSWHFAAEWVSDELKLAVGTNTDILDRHKNFFADGFCGRSEDTFSDAENAFIVAKAGPVRVIRSLLGANSGPLTQRTNIFYAGRQDISSDLRVHNIPSIVDAFDYSPAASGMTYRNNLNLNGVTVNGQPDQVTLGDLTWEQVSGAPGTLSILHSRTTDLTTADAIITSYYDDNSAAPASTCTGDGQAWGTSGVRVLFPGSACTDPLPAAGCGTASASFHSLRFTRTLYVDAPTAPASTAATYHQQRLNPLQVTAATYSTLATAPAAATFITSLYPNPATAGRVLVQAAQACQLRVYNALGQPVATQDVPAGTHELTVSATGLLLFVFTSEAGQQVFRQVMR